MRYKNITGAKFIERQNRFVAYVELDGRVETVHVKNTGRCKELLLPGSRVTLAKTDNPARKTQYDLIAVYKDGLGWVNIDSQAPNKVVKEWLNSSPELFDNITLIKPEYTYGKFRLDFYLECDSRKILIEVKGCTLEIACQYSDSQFHPVASHYLGIVKLSIYYPNPAYSAVDILNYTLQILFRL